MARYLAIHEADDCDTIHLLRIAPMDHPTYEGEEDWGVIACGATLPGDWAACNESLTALYLEHYRHELCPACLAAASL